MTKKQQKQLEESTQECMKDLEQYDKTGVGPYFSKFGGNSSVSTSIEKKPLLFSFTLLCADKRITQAQKRTFERNERIIQEFKRKPWWYRMINHDDVKQQIIGNWHSFEDEYMP